MTGSKGEVGVGQGFFELTSEEIIALATGLDYPVPRFLDRERVEGWPDEIREAVVSVGLRSLAARDLVRGTVASMEVPALVAELALCLCRPGLVAETSVVTSGRSQSVLFYATPSWASGHRSTNKGNHRFTLFPSDRLLEALLSAVNADELADSHLDESLAGVVALDDLIDDAGERGDPLVEALSDDASRTITVSVVYPTESGARGGTQSWLITNENSVVLIEKQQVEGGHVRLECTPCEPGDLIGKVRALLPS